jgi:two-component system, OmpR family, sensor kinase
VLMGRWLTRPLDRLAGDARRLFQTSENVPLAETGTREVRTLASAINDLQHRIKRLVDDRTQMLAAVSHDLRTPLTRLRLRIESVPNPCVRRSIEADLDEMEAMIDATLAFLRDDMASEEVEQVDLAAIIHTIADNAADAGQTVEVDIPRSIVVSGRHLALKRALTNLTQNGIKYGGSVAISAVIEDSRIGISIKDEGPGIPADKLDAVFEPFYRIEPSRGRRTGGHGLGLTVARTILRAHGGDVVLSNRTPRGLEAVVTLPVTAETVATSDRAVVAAVAS